LTVVDTSGVVDFLLGAGVAEEVEALIVHEGELSAPDLLVFETLAVLRRAVGRDRLSGARADAAVEDLGDMPIELFPTLSLRGRAWELRRNVTPADALFVALAEGVGEPLATKDTGLATAAERHADVQAVRLGGV
jgi:predicted nucleic acid-binding protein